MKSFKIPLIVGLVLVLLLVFYFVVFKKGQEKNELQPLSEQTEQKDEKASAGETIKGKITELFNSNKAMKCNYRYSDESTSSTTTVYISDKKMRGSSEVTTEGKDKINTEFVTIDNTMYTWSNQSEKGIKISIDPQDIENSEKNTEKYDFMTDKYEYECSPWVTDPSMFTLPKDIEFVDMSGITKMNNTETDEKGSICAACEFAQTDEEKTECLSSLGCK